MTLKEMIDQRRSCRSFTDAPVEDAVLDTIRAFPMKPLHPNIRVHWEIAARNQVKCLCPWTTQQLITVYSEEADGWLENVGFLFQQMDLYLQSIGLGVCWLGMGKLHPRHAPQMPGMQFVIMLAFGHPKGDLQPRKSFRRKRPEQIADQADPRLEPARLAPSSVNSQPWYFTHEGDTIHVYCPQKRLSNEMNRIDMGIALAHLYVANESSFRFFHAEHPPVVQGFGYIGSVIL